MFVDIDAYDCDDNWVSLTVNLNNVFFETCWPDYVKMFIIGHKEYYEHQAGSGYSSFRNKRYDYSLSWPTYNRLRGLMGLPIAHVRDCNIERGSSCECSGNGNSLISTDTLKRIKENESKYLDEHPPIFKETKWCDTCGHIVHDNEE